VEEEYPAHDKKEERKANWIGHIWRRNLLLKHVIEGETDRKIFHLYE